MSGKYQSVYPLRWSATPGMGFMLHHGVLLLYQVRGWDISKQHTANRQDLLLTSTGVPVLGARTGKQSNYYYILLGQAELFADRPLKLPIGIHAKYAIWVCLV